jgi:hypothetical protein
MDSIVFFRELDTDKHRFSGYFFILLSVCGKILKLQNKKPFPPP